MPRTNGEGGKLVPKLPLAYRNKSAMSQTEVAGWLCIPVCSDAFAFAGDDPLPRRAPTMTVADDSGNDRVNVTVAAASGATTHNLCSPQLIRTPWLPRRSWAT